MKIDQSVFSAPNIGPDGDLAALGRYRDRAGLDRYVETYLDVFAALPEPVETRLIETSFGAVRAYRFAPDPGVDPLADPLILLSGRHASTPMWRANLPGMLALRTVWSLDSIGEPGASVQRRALLSPEDQAVWIDEAIGGLGIAKAHVMGLSIGGNIAMQLGLSRPQRVASLILLDPAATFAPLTWKMVMVSLGSVIPGLPQVVRHWLLSWISGDATSSEGVPEGRLIASAMRDFVQRQPPPARPSPAALAALGLPVLAIIAGRSIVHGPAQAAAAARTIPGARVELWPDASHAVNGEFPERIAASVRSFLAGLP